MTTILTNTRKPDITISAKHRILLTSRLVTELDLQEGDIINIGIEDGEYYLFTKLKSADICGQHNARLFKPYRGAHVLCVNSKELATSILSILHRHRTAALAVGAIVTLPHIGKAATIIMHHIARDKPG